MFNVTAIPRFIRLKLQQYQGAQRIAGNMGWLFADRVVRMVMELVVGVLLARYLGPAQLGLLTYAIAFVGLFGAVATLGLDNIVVRDIVRNPRDADDILGTALTLRVLSAVVVYCVAVAIIVALRPGDTLVQSLVAITAFGFVVQSFDVIDFFFRSQVRSKYTVVARLIGLLLANILRVLLIWRHAPLLMFAWVALGELVFGSIGLIVAYRLSGHHLLAWRSRLQRGKQLLSESWPLILSGLAIMIYMRIDQIMVGTIRGNAEVGTYAVATRLSELWYFIPMALSTSVMPSVVAARQVSVELRDYRIQKLMSFMALVGYFVAVTVTFLANYIVGLLYGPDYAAAAAMLAILAWSGIFVCIGVIREMWMLTEGLQRYSFATTAIGALVNLVLNLVLIPPYGAAGAAVATLIAQFVAVVLATLVFPRTRAVFWMQVKALLMYGVFV
ncbi:MAG: flippase [Chloroflexota bacterium]|nr:flippase [Chloroflexota bacterium]